MTPTRSPRGLRTVVLLGLLGLATQSVAACAPGADSSAEPRRAAVALLEHQSLLGGLPEIPEGMADAISTGPGLRLALRSLLAEHTMLVGEVLVRAEAGSPDLEMAARALATDTEALTAAMRLVFGDAGASAFRELWAQHAEFLVDYAIALGAGDDGARDEARAALEHYHRDFSSFCNLALGLPRQAVFDLVAAHLRDLVGWVDASHRGDDVEVLANARSALEYAAPIADAIAAGIVTTVGGVDGAIDDPVTERAAAVAYVLADLELTALVNAGPPVPSPVGVGGPAVRAALDGLGEVVIDLAGTNMGAGDVRRATDDAVAALEQAADGPSDGPARTRLRSAAQAWVAGLAARLSQRQEPSASAPYRLPVVGAAELGSALAAATSPPTA